MANNQRVETLVDWNWVDRELVAFCHIAYGIMYPSTNWRAVARRYLIIGAPQNVSSPLLYRHSYCGIRSPGFLDMIAEC